MKITVIAVGRLKEQFYREAAVEYTKRLGRYCKLEIIQVDDEKTPEDASPAEEERILRKEAERILKRLKEGACVITLEIGGRMYDSLEFACEIEKLQTSGVSHIQFVIGGSLGLHETVRRMADRSVSFSKMTFPHQLMRVILLEQIYRACRIIQGEPYHK